jgi:hypothetical protein
MGSVEGFQKDDHPLGNFAQRHNDEHNMALRRERMAAPLWRRVLLTFGMRLVGIGFKMQGPFNRWTITSK